MKTHFYHRDNITGKVQHLFVVLIAWTSIVHAGTIPISKQIEALKRYQKEVRDLILDAKLATDATPLPVSEYLSICSDNANLLFEILESPTNQRHQLSRELTSSLRLRIEKQDELIDANLSTNPFVGSENQLREELARSAVAFNEIYIESLLIQKTLLGYKYFEDDDPKSGNFLEGFLNSNVSFLRYSSDAQNKDSWHRHHGVSNWEMTIRVEPVVLFNHEKDPAVLFAGGLLYNIFPSVRSSKDNPFAPTIDHNLLSKYIKRLGPRFGVGTRFGEGTDFIFGGGFQIATFSAWSVYDSSESEFTWAVGLSDWKWVNKILPMFGKN